MEQDTARTLRPERSLLTYYMLRSLMFGPGFVFAAPAFYFRFRSLRYEVDDEGITMRWGVLFRREISLTYARIQDIQLSSNVVERWLNLARIELQTASGSSSAEMTIEGMRDVESFRDFLYSRMRGVGSSSVPSDEAPMALGEAQGVALAALAPASGRAAPEPAEMHELVDTLNAVAAEVRALRLSLQPDAATLLDARDR